MSGPFTPPQNRVPQVLPMGQTRKPLGAERIPMDTGAPPPSPAARLIRAAVAQGVDPSKLSMRPGYTPAPEVPRSQLPIPAKTLPDPNILTGPIPMPRPRPNVDPYTGQVAPDKPYQADAIKRLQQEIYGDKMPSSTVAPEPPLSPEDQQQADLRARGRQILIDQLAKNQAATQSAAPKDVEKSAGPEPYKAPQTTGQAGAPQQFTPAQQQGNIYYQKDPNAEYDKKGKGKDKALKANKEEKGHSLNYYRILGVDPAEGKVAANAALQQLIKRARERPETLTRDEDRLLASAGSEPAGYRSLTEADVQKRFEGYQPGTGVERGQSTASKGRFDPAAATVQDVIANRGAPIWQGAKLPTQADVNAQPQAPQQFQQKFPSYTPPPPKADITPEVEAENPDEGD